MKWMTCSWYRLLMSKGICCLFSKVERLLILSLVRESNTLFIPFMLMDHQTIKHINSDLYFFILNINYQYLNKKSILIIFE